MANTYVKIASVTVGAGGASSIDFTSIPGTYDDLALHVTARNTRNAFVASYVTIKFNGSGSNYTYKLLEGIPGISTGSTNQTSVGLTTDMVVGSTSQTNSTASTFGSSFIYIPNYAGSTNKSVSAEGVSETDGTSTLLILSAGLWSDTTAISSITLKTWVSSAFFDFTQYSTATLYGIKKS